MDPALKRALQRATVSGKPTRAKGATTPELKALQALRAKLADAVGPTSSNEGHLLGGSENPRARGTDDQARAPKAAASVPAWVRKLKLPSYGPRLDPLVVYYLEYFRNTPRGRSMLAYAYKRSGRYSELVGKELKQAGLPPELMWVSIVESGMDPRRTSHAGAAGLWQFMPKAGEIYGLKVSRFRDDRKHPERSTRAAAKYFRDLHTRFGSWDLALAAYNMGYGGLLRAMRKYNTNDFWQLVRLEAGIPWETTLYVPKIIAFGIAANNPKAFHLERLKKVKPAELSVIRLGPGISFEAMAQASGCKEAEFAKANPHLPAGGTPPPHGKSGHTVGVYAPPKCKRKLQAKLASFATPSSGVRSYRVRFGDSIYTIARRYGVSRGRLRRLNGLRAYERLRAGENVYLPSWAKAKPQERPVVVIPARPLARPGSARVFYRVALGDTLGKIGHAFGVPQPDLLRWNDLNPTARLQAGMMLQVFVSSQRDLSHIATIRPEDARVLVLGSQEFFAHFEAKKGRRRFTIVVKRGDTMASISRRYGISQGMLARINRRPRNSKLQPKELLVVYSDKVTPAAQPKTAPGWQPLPPTKAPHPELLPGPKPPVKATTPPAGKTITASL